MFELKKIATLAGKEPGIYEGTDGKLIYAVAIGATGVGIETRPVNVTPEPPPRDEWKEVEALDILTPEAGITQVLYGAQPNAISMRLRCKWTARDVGDEYEVLALVARKGKVPKWPDLPLYLTIRNGDAARFRTGVGDIKMEHKATARATWAPKAGTTYDVEATIWHDGEIDLWVEESGEIEPALRLNAKRPKEGEPGPWTFPLMAQLGGPAGKAGGGHVFSDVVLEVREGA